MRKFLLFVTISTLLCLPTLCFSFVNAANITNIMPTYLLSLNNIPDIQSVNITSDLDADSPVLRTSVRVKTDKAQTVCVQLPLYGQYYNIDVNSAALLLNGERISPFLSYAADPFGIISNYSYQDILDLNITAELPDGNMPCYYYAFSTDTNGTATFTVPTGSVLFTSFYSHSYSSVTNEYTLKLEMNRPQSLLIFDNDICISDSENCQTEKQSLICSDVLNYAIDTALLISDNIDTDAETITEIVKAKFSYCFVSTQRTHDLMEEVINAPFKFGITFLNYVLTISNGSSIIESEQKFLFTTDGTYEPFVQNFYIVSPDLQTVTINLTTSRFLLNDEKADFDKTQQGYFYKGKLTENLVVNLCDTHAPSSLIPKDTHRIFPVWAIIIISVLTVAFIFCITYLLISYKKGNFKK